MVKLVPRRFLLVYIKIIFLLSVIVLTESAYYTDVVQTKSGHVRGEILTTARKSFKYASFKGIPYAEAPVRDLRFKPPVGKRNWTGVFNATKEGNICVQYNAGNASIIGSEDCLILNIFTPHTNFTVLSKRDLKAVMVWIYGGGFSGGYSLSSVFGPDYLLEEDVILVSFNYRLGPLGFLNLNHDNATGNAALKDQNLALKWVNKNIAKFGGDPRKVTIFGQSAGAVSVDLHILSDMSVGLFSQSISMSGSPLCLYWGLQTNKEAESQAFELGSKLGINTTSKHELLEGLYTTSANDIIKKANELPLMPFRPTIERTNDGKNPGKFLSDCTLNKYLIGKYIKGAHMMGFTSNEAKSFLGSSDDALAFAKKALELLNNAAIPLDIPNIRKFITAVENSRNISEQAFQEMIQVASDLYFVTGIDSKQNFLNIHNDFPIFYYRFSFETALYQNQFNNQVGNYNLTGVGHGEDLPYVFYMPFSGMPINQPDIAITIDRYVRLITNFAKHGNPTPYGRQDSVLNIIWPNSGMHGLYIEINKTLSIGLRPISSNVRINEIAGIGNSLLLNDCISIENCRAINNTSL